MAGRQFLLGQAFDLVWSCAVVHWPGIVVCGVGVRKMGRRSDYLRKMRKCIIWGWVMVKREEESKN